MGLSTLEIEQIATSGAARNRLIYPQGRTYCYQQDTSRKLNYLHSRETVSNIGQTARCSKEGFLDSQNVDWLVRYNIKASGNV